MRRKILCVTRVWASVLAIAIPVTLSAQQQVDRYEVGRAAPPLDPGKTILPLSLEEAVNRALEMNLDIQTAKLNPQIQRYAMQVARAAFDPTLTTNLGHNSSSAQSTSQLDGGARTSTTRNTYNASLSQPLQWYGARLNANFRDEYYGLVPFVVDRPDDLESPFRVRFDPPDGGDRTAWRIKARSAPAVSTLSDPELV